VYSAFPVDARHWPICRPCWKSALAASSIVSVELDASLIGGVRVVVGDEVLDTSVKARLEQMKTALTA
jgi:F-type H+-transporting ATPase subunit delta